MSTLGERACLDRGQSRGSLEFRGQTDVEDSGGRGAGGRGRRAEGGGGGGGGSGCRVVGLCVCNFSPQIERRAREHTTPTRASFVIAFLFPRAARSFARTRIRKRMKHDARARHTTPRACAIRSRVNELIGLACGVGGCSPAYR